jgi:hypothetical protein
MRTKQPVQRRSIALSKPTMERLSDLRLRMAAPSNVEVLQRALQRYRELFHEVAPKKHSM